MLWRTFRSFAEENEFVLSCHGHYVPYSISHFAKNQWLFVVLGWPERAPSIFLEIFTTNQWLKRHLVFLVLVFLHNCHLRRNTQVSSCKDQVRVPSKAREDGLSIFHRVNCFGHLGRFVLQSRFIPLFCWCQLPHYNTSKFKFSYVCNIFWNFWNLLIYWVKK